MANLRRFNPFNPLFWHAYLTQNGFNMSEQIKVRDGWDPDDPHLHILNAPHEMRAVRRMHTNGWPGYVIYDFLKMTPAATTRELSAGMSEENDAHADGRYIHAETAPKAALAPAQDAAPGTLEVYVRAKYVSVGDVVVSKGAAVVKVDRAGNDVVLVLDGGRRFKYRPLDELLVRRSGTQ